MRSFSLSIYQELQNQWLRYRPLESKSPSTYMYLGYINHHRPEFSTANPNAKFLPTCHQLLDLIALGGVDRLRLHLGSLPKEETERTRQALVEWWVWSTHVSQGAICGMILRA